MRADERQWPELLRASRDLVDIAGAEVVDLVAEVGWAKVLEWDGSLVWIRDRWDKGKWGDESQGWNSLA